MAETEKKVVEVIHGKFRAELDSIFRDGDTTVYDDGSKAIGMSFRVCTIDRFIVNKAEVAAKLTDFLNQHWKDD